MKKSTILLLTLLVIFTSCNQLLIKDSSTPTEGVNRGNISNKKIDVPGSISGQVKLTDKTADLSGVMINLEGLSYGAISDKRGNYKIEQVPAGRYNLIYSKKGYEKVIIKDIVVKENSDSHQQTQQLKSIGLKISYSSLREGSPYNSLNNHHLTFTETLDPDSILLENIIFQGGVSPIKVIGFRPYYNRLSLILNDNLEYSTNYTLLISGLRSYNGTTLSKPEVINFKTHAGPPEIIALSLTNEARDFPVYGTITIKYNRDMDESTINNKNFKLLPVYSYNEKPHGDVSYNKLNKSVTITPNRPLDPGTKYLLVIQPYQIRDINGVAASDFREKDKVDSLVSSIYFETIPQDFTNAMGKWTEAIVNGGWYSTCFSFDGVAGKRYELAWDDKGEGSGKYIIDCEMSWNNGERHSFNSSEGPSYSSGYINPPKFDITKTGKVYFYMTNRNGQMGTIAIKVTELP